VQSIECLTDVILAALNSLVVTLIKTQAIAPLVLKADKVILVHHHSVVDGEDHNILQLL
jgi:hypothetical protein